MEENKSRGIKKEKVSHENKADKMTLIGLEH